MGTGFSIRTSRPLSTAAKSAVRAALQNVDTHMSTWRVDSELTRFNTSVDTDWQPLTASTIAVVAEALQISKAGKGAFDISVGPLVDLWGFGALAHNDTSTASAKPDRQAILRTLAGVGHDTIEVDIASRTLRKRNSASRIDLSGIAKGHAVDQVASALNNHGFDDFLVEVGGELRSRGTKPDGSAWRVAIERPQVGRRSIFRVIDLINQAIATSGDYRNFFDAGGQRYSHSIDPRTGQPVNHELASVSVVASSAMSADALSTSLMIMGPNEAMAFAERYDIAVHLILKSIKIRDYMAAGLITFSPDTEMRQAIAHLVQKRISGAPVVDDHGNLVGVLSEQDCMKVALSAGYHDDHGGLVKDYMSAKVTTIEADTSILQLAQLFIDAPFRRYPVMENNRLVGQISRRDVLRALESLT